MSEDIFPNRYTYRKQAIGGPCRSRDNEAKKKEAEKKT
jgi:hypothetical protein